MASPISVGEWQKALEELESRQVDGFTTIEAAEALGMPLRRTREQMSALFRAGRIRLAGMRRVPRMDGRMDNMPVYQWVQESKNGQHGKG